MKQAAKRLDAVPRPPERANNYAFLLVGLVGLLLLVPLLQMRAAAGGNADLLRLLLHIDFGGMMLVGVWSLIRNRLLFKVGLALAGLNIVFIGLATWLDHPWFEVGGLLIVIPFCAISAFIAGRHVFGNPRVDSNLIYGAICLYLLAGLVWAIAYELISMQIPHAFNGLDAGGRPSQFNDFLYFSFVTLASLGYGDITPAAPLARTLAYFEVIAGQFYLAIMVAGLVGLYMKEREER